MPNMLGTGCGCSSVVERQLPKLNVVGSIPITRSNFFKELNKNWVFSSEILARFWLKVLLVKRGEQ
jgi:hypothetical protein